VFEIFQCSYHQGSAIDKLIGCGLDEWDLVTGKDITFTVILSPNQPHFEINFLPWCNSPQWAKASSLSRLYDHTQLHTPHLVGIIWTSDQPDTDTST